MRSKDSDLAAVLSCINDGKITLWPLRQATLLPASESRGPGGRRSLPYAAAAAAASPTAHGGGDLLKLDDALAQVDDFGTQKAELDLMGAVSDGAHFQKKREEGKQCGIFMVYSGILRPLYPGAYLPCGRRRSPGLLAFPSRLFGKGIK